MDSTLAPKNKRVRDQSGIALFMVLSAVSILSILVTEFTYVAQVNQRMAYDGLDQIKAHYLAKSGFKISLLRLKAYQKVKEFASGAGSGLKIPKQALEKIWSFPFMYPIPTSIPGLTPGDKDRIDAFQKESGLEGSFSAVIDSESSKYNLNTILSAFAAPAPSPSPSPTPGGGGTPGGTSGTTTAATFDPAQARRGLYDYLEQILNQKIQTDPDFASEYRDLRLEDLANNIIAWADPSFESTSSPGREQIPPKKAPFYSVTELHMVDMIDDQLYDLFTPSLTASTTPGINVNTMKAETLKALVPQMTPEESDEFIKFRDSSEEDNFFKTADEFFKYLQEKIAAFNNDPEEIRRYKEDLTKKNIRIIVDEQIFKITVRSEVNMATRIYEAWVTLTTQKAPAPPPPGRQGTPVTAQETPANLSKAGLKVTFMRIL